VGGRSAKACTQMDRLDLATVNLLGGLKAWEAAGGKPVKGK
jgi:rhodanese-related sulfurtransferase